MHCISEPAIRSHQPAQRQIGSELEADELCTGLPGLFPASCRREISERSLWSLLAGLGAEEGSFDKMQL